MRISFISFWIKALLLVSVSMSGCAYREFQEDPIPADAGTGRIEYPLQVSLNEGLTGSFALERLPDGTARCVLQLQGFDPGRRYFANISRSDAHDFGSTPVIADLKEVIIPTGTSTTWLHKDYLNHPLQYDSLIEANAMVKVFEFDPATPDSPKEVLRGDIGGNLLTTETRSYTLTPTTHLNIGGTVTFTKRRNGHYLVQSTITGLDSHRTATQSIYIGDTAESFQVLRRLSPIAGFSGRGVSRLTEFNVAELDTLKGFLGLGYTTDTVLAMVNFPANVRPPSRSATINLYNNADSSLAGTLTFQERGGRLRLSWSFHNIPGGETFFLSFHRGFSLDTLDPYYTLPIPVQKDIAGQESRLHFPISQQGSILWREVKFDELDTLNLHIRLTSDTANFTTTRAGADLGVNALSGRAIMVPIPDLTGGAAGPQNAFAAIRELKSHRAFFDLKLDNTVTLAEHYFNLRQGHASATDQGTLLAKISVILGNGTALRQRFTPKRYEDGTLITYESIITGNAKYLEVEFDLGQPWCGGDIPQ